MNQNNYWSNYKVEVTKNMEDYGPSTKTVLLYGITTEVGNLLQCSSKEICLGEPAIEERVESLGDLFWYIAALEIHFNLPNSIYSNYIGTPMSINPNHGLELIGLHSDLTGYLSEISEAMLGESLDDLQYNINKFLYSVYNVFIYYGMNPLGVLKDSLGKMLSESQTPEKPDYKAEYERDRQKYKELDYQEILLDVKIDKRCKKHFKGVLMTAYGKEYYFDSGDVIADFFSATNTLYTEFEKQEAHIINYSPRFREYLEEEQPYVESGFIIGKNVVSMQNILKNATIENGKVRIGAKARPVLMFQELNTLEKLLDYVLDARKDK